MFIVKSDEGRTLGTKPKILLCGMSNREKAFYIAKADRFADNLPNPNCQVVDVIVTLCRPSLLTVLAVAQEASRDTLAIALSVFP